MARAPHLARGAAAERYARRWLEQHGLTFICANYRCKAGELDLVMSEAQCLVIVEVRYRHHPSHGGALGSITPTKRERIMRATRHLLQCHPELQQQALRFDVLALTGDDNAIDVDWRRRAFYAT